MAASRGVGAGLSACGCHQASDHGGCCHSTPQASRGDVASWDPDHCGHDTFGASALLWTARPCVKDAVKCAFMMYQGTALEP